MLSSYESALPSLDIEYITHTSEGKPIIFAVDREAKDTYTNEIRKKPNIPAFISYILRKSQKLQRKLKVADFGANVGIVALPLAANGMNVLAVEPLPINFILLVAAIRANRFNNLLPVNLAVFEKPGLVSLSGFGPWATIGIAGGKNIAAAETLVTILETYGFADVDILKIDIEGAELPSLLPATDFIAGHPNVEIIYESNNHACRLFNYDRQDMMRWFEEQGFNNYVFRDDGLMPVTADNPQPRPVVDVLATRCSLSELERRGERILPLTDEYIVEQLRRISHATNPAIRTHFVTEAGRAGKNVAELEKAGDERSSRLRPADSTALSVPRNKQEGISGMVHVLGVSMPRSGHHLVEMILNKTLKDKFSYCEFYSPGCCNAIPCRDRSRTTAAQGHVFLQKSHDFKFDDPLVVAGTSRLIQLRSPVPRSLSNYELYLRNGATDSITTFRDYLVLEALYFCKFYAKWVANPLPDSFLLSYEELIADPLKATLKLLSFLGSPTEMDRVAEGVAAATQLRGRDNVPFVPTDVSSHRYATYPVLANFEDIVIRNCPGYAPVRYHFSAGASSDSLIGIMFSAMRAVEAGKRDAAMSFIEAALPQDPASPLLARLREQASALPIAPVRPMMTEAQRASARTQPGPSAEAKAQPAESSKAGAAASMTAKPAHPAIRPSERVIYLHIGTEKTGSTALQAAASAARDTLRQQGVLYPRVPGEDNQYKLALYATGDARLRAVRNLDDDRAWQQFRKTFPDELRAELQRDSCATVVLSSEHLSSRIGTVSQVQVIADLLQPFGSVQVVCYIRPQHELYVSNNSDFIKAGGTFFQSLPKKEDSYYNYELMLAPWSAVFGDTNIIVRIYDRKLLLNADIVTDFFSLVGCREINNDGVSANLNRSLDSKTLRFLMLANRHLPPLRDGRWNPERGRLTEALEAVATGPKKRYRTEELRQILALYERSNAAVAKRFLGRADGVLFPNLTITAETEPEELTVERAVEIAAHLWRWKNLREGPGERMPETMGPQQTQVAESIGRDRAMQGQPGLSAAPKSGERATGGAGLIGPPPILGKDRGAVIAPLPPRPNIRWFHSFDLGNGEVINGIKPLAVLRREADNIFSEPVHGKTVLDIGAWDGYFSFEAERRNASTVLATDHFCWSGAGWGTKAGFNYIHAQTGSRVRSLDVDVFDLDPQALGTFDVCLFLGVLYHLKNPLGGLEKLARMTGERAVIETQVDELNNPNPVMRFFEGKELNNDATNFFAPNNLCLEAMLREVGFKRFKFIPSRFPAGVQRGRSVVHAWK